MSVQIFNVLSHHEIICSYYSCHSTSTELIIEVFKLPWLRKCFAVPTVYHQRAVVVLFSFQQTRRCKTARTPNRHNTLLKLMQTLNTIQKILSYKQVTNKKNIKYNAQYKRSKNNVLKSQTNSKGQ